MHKILSKYAQEKLSLIETFPKSVAPSQSNTAMNYLSQRKGEEKTADKLNAMIKSDKIIDTVGQAIILFLLDKQKEK